MKYATLRLCGVEGKLYKKGDIVELSESAAKRYVDAGFIRAANTDKPAADSKANKSAKAEKTSESKE
ncbi:MAG: hypothetical protein LBU73_04925 [Helicobacteraceae bacterium]|jgi:hypothetical protein|nr:hypothetical protein [Helicobacteraceae bacterium]